MRAAPNQESAQPELFAPLTEPQPAGPSIRFWPPHGTKVRREDGSIAMIDWTQDPESNAALRELRRHVRIDAICQRCGEPVPLIPIQLVNIKRRVARF
jgi:hypothetical protein